MEPMDISIERPRFHARKRAVTQLVFRKLWACAGLMKQCPNILCGSERLTRSLVINSVSRVKIDPLRVIMIIWDEIKPAVPGGRYLAAVENLWAVGRVDLVSGP